MVTLHLIDFSRDQKSQANEENVHNLWSGHECTG